MLKAIALKPETIDVIAKEINWRPKDVSDYYETVAYRTHLLAYVIVDPEKTHADPTIYLNEAFHEDYKFYEDEKPLEFSPIVRQEKPASQ